MIQVKVLIISDKYDFTTDFVCVELEKKKIDYIRLNRDEFHNYQISTETSHFNIYVNIEERQYCISEKNLISVYYRAPVFLREIYDKQMSVEEQLYREQWMSFIRNLMLFENVRWINSPEKTYKAENKILQLKYAKQLGFKIPHTIVTNTIPTNLQKEKYVVKSLDTAFFKINNKEGFIYSNILNKSEIESSNIKLAPITIQDYINPKTDIRVTVVGSDIFATCITINGQGIDIDWRKAKDEVEFKSVRLSTDIKEKCIKLVKKLGLNFGAIDLLETEEGDYYFLEINPTGEWAWLVHTTNSPIHKSIANLLVYKP